MVGAIVFRRFNHDGAYFDKDQPIALDDGTFAALEAIGLVKKAPKPKLPAKQ